MSPSNRIAWDGSRGEVATATLIAACTTARRCQQLMILSFGLGTMLQSKSLLRLPVFVGSPFQGSHPWAIADPGRCPGLSWVAPLGLAQNRALGLVQKGAIGLVQNRALGLIRNGGTRGQETQNAASRPPHLFRRTPSPPSPAPCKLPFPPAGDFGPMAARFDASSARVVGAGGGSPGGHGRAS